MLKQVTRKETGRGNGCLGGYCSLAMVKIEASHRQGALLPLNLRGTLGDWKKVSRC